MWPRSTRCAVSWWRRGSAISGVLALSAGCGESQDFIASFPTAECEPLADGEESGLGFSVEELHALVLEAPPVSVQWEDTPGGGAGEAAMSLTMQGVDAVEAERCVSLVDVYFAEGVEFLQLAVPAEISLDEGKVRSEGTLWLQADALDLESVLVYAEHLGATLEGDYEDEAWDFIEDDLEGYSDVEWTDSRLALKGWWPGAEVSVLLGYESEEAEVGTLATAWKGDWGFED
jgi:hypothetical protein